MKQSSIICFQVLATNMHLLPEFGNSINEFYNDEITVDHKIYMALSGYTNTTMVKSLGVFMLSVADILSNTLPDIILLAGDRGEQLVAAITGAHMNIPVAHIQAGELSGNVDGLTRHAIARFAHIHFASNQDAEQRLINTGEEPFRVFNVGAPQLDDFYQNEVAPPNVVAEYFSIDRDKPLIMVVQHPVTEQSAVSGEQMMATLQAVLTVGLQSVIIYPNNDAGSIAIQECIKQNRGINIRVARNISRYIYGGLMSIASVMIGNSSSGILEAPTFKLPAVNIGRRQHGRYQGKNVINVEKHDKLAIETAIRKAISTDFRESIKDIVNPYGDGKASDRILSILENIPIDEKLIYKRITL
ncbi:UDP-N-acetylglucosamine 2-epimerase [Candidatus Magnetobacterium bavaricum]|uniref:UDP-N-acetylglucosamine 2-epimerase n=1 Tax=Candidatus Magnetobacterium bavaricum TaxID=29290 RepID=A0A0F3GHP5_9BACT|nr:UDP-N-acetylglucosamine 2-epimerase [Candidatus Magnetobacterium bavaricum]